MWGCSIIRIQTQDLTKTRQIIFICDPQESIVVLVQQRECIIESYEITTSHIFQQVLLILLLLLLYGANLQNIQLKKICLVYPLLQMVRNVSTPNWNAEVRLRSPLGRICRADSNPHSSDNLWVCITCSLLHKTLCDRNQISCHANGPCSDQGNPINCWIRLQ